MRPLQLRLTAFGPFANEQLIDFEALGPAALFLIEGATGAGKTTILDAICYALYDKSTGGEREARHMRSDFAAADVLTEVELTFALGCDRYRIRRTPEQMRPARRGSGMSKQSPIAELVRLEDQSETVLVARKVGDANAAIAELTGLTVEQFRQVMVLPQGQFRRLLTAESKERQGILQDLFGAALYSEVAEKLKALSSGMVQQDRELVLRLKALQHSASLSAEQDLGVALDNARESVKQKQQQRQRAESALQVVVKQLSEAEQLAAAHAALCRIDEQLAELDRQRPFEVERQALLAQLEAAESMRAAWQALQIAELEFRRSTAECERAEQQLAQTRETVQGADQVYQRASAEHQRRDDIARAVHDLNLSLPRLVELERAAELADQATRHLNSMAEQRDEAARSLVAEESLADNARLMLNQSELDAARVPNLQQKLAMQLRVEGLKADRKKLQDRTAQFARQRQVECANRDNARKVLEGAAGLRTRAERLWLDHQAVALAATLQRGSPCPVCGSTDHPDPATAKLDEANSEQLDISALRGAERDAVASLNESQNRLQATEREIASMQQEQTRLDSALADLSIEFDPELEPMLARAEASAAKLPSLHSKLDVVSESVSLHRKAHVRATEAYQHALQRQAAADQRLDQLRETFGDPTPVYAELVARRESLSAEKRRLESQFVATQEALNQARLASVQALSRLESAHDTTRQHAAQRGTMQKNWQAVLRDSPFDAESAFLQALESLGQRDDILAESEAFQHSVQSANAMRMAQASVVADRPPPDLERLQMDRARARAQLDETSAALGDAEARLNQLLNTSQAIHELNATRRNLNKRFRVAGGLSEAANGQNALRLNFQSFVLSVLLDDVLIAADQRLLQMTSGRYRLVRREGVTHGARQTGLDLDVDDAHTGRRRRADTLSGGESFMAALSLALGLSDVVQSHAGGIRLDTLFIDEGFGSLDAEALDLAVSALVDLQSSGRLIGVISHVPELREQIQSKVIVRKGVKGSRATLVVNPGVSKVDTF